MIEKRELRAMIIVFIVIAALAIMMIFQLYSAKSEDEVYRISVILDATQDDYWKLFKKGVDKAALDYNVDVHFVPPSNSVNIANQQIGLVVREIESGVDAIILFPEDKQKISEWLDGAQISCPIITVGTSLSSSKETRHVGSDDIQMGAKLADAILSIGCKNIIVLTEFSEQSNSQERFLGFTARMDEMDISFARCADMRMVYSSIDSIKNSLTPYALVAFDASGTMQMTAPVTQGYNGLVFGMESTSVILGMLEADDINTLIVQSDFDIGYVAVKNAVSVLNGEKVESNMLMDSYVVNQKNMFTDPIARVLVPVS